MTAMHDPTKDLAVEFGAPIDHALSAVKEWPHVVNDGFAALNSDTEFDLRMRMRALPRTSSPDFPCWPRHSW